MLGNTVFLIGLVVAAGVGLAYFRDLGDVSQMIMRVKRENMIRFIRNEYRLLAIGLGATALMALAILQWTEVQHGCSGWHCYWWVCSTVFLGFMCTWAFATK